MAKDRNECFSNYLLVLAALFLTIQGAASQKVKVEPEVVSYPGETVNLRCSFLDHGGIQLTQVSWIWEPKEGARDNIAVYHPTFGASYPDSPLKGRVSFTNPSLENPSIEISGVKMTDEGSYVCEYATYPSGNEQGTTVLVMLAKPKNTASIVTVTAGPKPVVVARCESADGKPPAQIKWVSVVNGNGTVVSKPGADSTVTVTSEYRLVPTPADNGKDLSCVVSHRTQDKPQSLPLKLAIEYPPQVTVVGYDNNWYVGRADVSLTCQATGNPIPDSVDWKVLSGQMPETVQRKGNKLVVLKVDDRVNTTFVCEVKNRLGVGKDQVTVMVRVNRLPMKGATTGSIIGAIIGVIILLAIIATAVVMIRKHRNKNKDVDGPPNYKPPPPKKMGGSTEQLAASRENVTEALPLNMYYETNGEPVTNLDAYSDEEPGYNDDSGHEGAPSGLEESALHAMDDEHLYVTPADVDYQRGEEYPGGEEYPRGEEYPGGEEYPRGEEYRGGEDEAEPHPAPSRGDSFMSPAMYV